MTSAHRNSFNDPPADDSLPRSIGPSGEVSTPEASPLLSSERRSARVAFRCYFMNGDRILGVHINECADDAEAILMGWALLESTPEHPALEIWDGKRMVARLDR